MLNLGVRMLRPGWIRYLYLPCGEWVRLVSYLLHPGVDAGDQFWPGLHHCTVLYRLPDPVGPSM